MDVRMPRMDGLQATRLIKARWPQIKVIMLTLYGEYESEALAAGADAGQPPLRCIVIQCEQMGSSSRSVSFPLFFRHSLTSYGL